MNVQQKRIAESVCKVTGVNIFENTRKREVVEARAMLNYIYRKVCGLTYYVIKRIYLSQGKSMNHATIIHSVKNYEMYEKYNPSLREMRMLVLASDRSTATDPLRKEFIRENIKHMDSEIVENVYEIIYDNC